jgi:hypothetical protein
MEQMTARDVPEVVGIGLALASLLLDAVLWRQHQSICV